MTKPRNAIFTLLVKVLLPNCKNSSTFANGMTYYFFKMPQACPQLYSGSSSVWRRRDHCRKAKTTFLEREKKIGAR